jgi:DNA processing protein
MIDKHLVLHLSLIQGIGPVAIAKIATALSLKENSDAYSFLKADWIALGVSDTQAQLLVDGLADRALLDKELALIEKAGAQFYTIIDDEYPEQLKQIYAPPAVLYCQGGSLNSLRSLAFIGSRAANQYAQRTINALIPDLVAQGITIVSGGAIGADSMAHRATLDAGGKTIAVLGSGLLKKYPYRNKQLFDEIIARDGVVLSIFPMLTEPFPGNFTARNRVIAGLSNGVVVVQAAAQSGTRITAQFALEQNRDVFAVPGSIEDPLSAGCHALISEGARIISSSQDILQEYGMVQLEIIEPAKKEYKPAKIAAAAPALSVRSLYPKDSLEQRILDFCSVSQSLDEIALKTESTPVKLQGTLFQLQLAGVLEQDFTGLWRTL